MTLVLFGLCLFGLSAATASQRLTLGERLHPKVAYTLSANLSPLSRLIKSVSRSLRGKKLANKAFRSASLPELLEVVDVLFQLNLLLTAGESVLGAIDWLGRRSGSKLGEQLRAISRRIHAGGELEAELLQWQTQAASLEEQELASKLLLATGSGADIVAALKNMARSIEDSARAARLAAMAKSETRMMLPIVFVILPITVIFAVFPSITLLNIGFSQ